MRLLLNTYCLGFQLNLVDSEKYFRLNINDFLKKKVNLSCCDYIRLTRASTLIHNLATTMPKSNIENSLSVKYFFVYIFQLNCRVFITFLVKKFIMFSLPVLRKLLEERRIASFLILLKFLYSENINNSYKLWEIKF